MSRDRWVIDRRRVGVIVFGCWLASVLAPALAGAGTGRFAGGAFDFCVSVRFNATAAQLQKVRDRFQGGSDVLLDATDDQHRFRNVYVVNKSLASSAAEFWVVQTTPAGKTAQATYGLYGKRGQHVITYYDTNFDVVNQVAENHTIAHEQAHHAYGLGDEYVKANGAAGGMCVATPPMPKVLNACLMDNYYTRGGPGVTLNEFCVKGAGDYQHTTDNYQHALNNGKACWETIGASKFTITAPAGDPTSQAPASQALTFPATSPQRRVIVLIDRSGSTEGGKLALTKRAARQFVKLLPNGDGLAIVDFDNVVKVTYPFTTLTGNADRNAAVTAINRLKAGRLTAIGNALLKGVDILQALSDTSCQTLFVLFSDGLHNTGPAPSTAIPFIQAKLGSVIAVAVGKDADVRRMQQLADQTGGKFFRVEKVPGLNKAITELDADVRDGGVLARAPAAITQGGQAQLPVDVDATTTQVTFVLNWENETDDLDLTLLDPSATPITPNDVGPGITFHSDPGSEMFVIDNPAPGQWTMVIDGVAVSGSAALFADAFSDSTQVGLTATPEVLEVTYPDPILLETTPFYDLPVVGGTVTATVLRPDGSTAAVVLVDDGSPASGDKEADDGTYSALFDAYTIDGTYDFDFSGVNQTGTAAQGETFFGPGSPLSLPPFQRRTSAAVLVTGIPAPPIDPVDHFQCYETRRSQFLREGISLVDQFGSSTVRLLRPANVCAPANKNGEDPTAPNHPAHLTDYLIRQTPRFAGVDEQLVVNQFGELVVDVRKPARLMVPSAKGLAGPPSPLTSEPDHFKCYKVRVTPGAPRFTPMMGVQIQDQFGTRTVDVLKPLRLCAPANKNGENPGAEDHPEHLMCYRTRGSAPFGDQPVSIDNQFGPQSWSLIRSTDLCVPSLKNPMVTTSTTTTATTSSTTTSTVVGSPSGAFVESAAR